MPLPLQINLSSKIRWTESHLRFCLSRSKSDTDIWLVSILAPHGLWWLLKTENWFEFLVFSPTSIEKKRLSRSRTTHLKYHLIHFALALRMMFIAGSSLFLKFGAKMLLRLYFLPPNLWASKALLFDLIFAATVSISLRWVSNSFPMLQKENDELRRSKTNFSGVNWKRAKTRSRRYERSPDYTVALVSSWYQSKSLKHISHDDWHYLLLSTASMLSFFVILIKLLDRS